MLTYSDFTRFFGCYLANDEFQAFLAANFNDLTEYNIFNGYIISASTGIELGFKNDDAVYDDDEEVVFEKGNPVLSHFILHPNSTVLIDEFPFDIKFSYLRNAVIEKVGVPLQTKKGYMDFLKTNFLVDSYKTNNIVISFDYNPDNETINHIQVRDNNLVEHLKL